MFNLTYNHLQETSPLIKSLYETFDKDSKKISKILNRKYKSKGENAVDAMGVFYESMNILPSHLSAIEKEYTNKSESLKKEFIPKMEASLNDVKIGVEYLESLPVGEKYTALAEQPELRSLLTRHGEVFGKQRVQQSFDMMDEVFHEAYAKELQPVQEAFNAIKDLKLSYEHQLKEKFNAAGGFDSAMSIYDNFLDDQVET